MKKGSTKRQSITFANTGQSWNSFLEVKWTKKPLAQKVSILKGSNKKQEILMHSDSVERQTYIKMFLKNLLNLLKLEKTCFYFYYLCLCRFWQKEDLKFFGCWCILILKGKKIIMKEESKKVKKLFIGNFFRYAFRFDWKLWRISIKTIWCETFS